MANTLLGSDFNLSADISPDMALLAQRLNRRQRIAELLLKQGLSGVQNEQHGRFYVPPSPWQYLAKLGEVAAGAAMTSKGDEELMGLADQHKKLRAEAIQDYLKTTAPTPETPEVIPPVPTLTMTPPERPIQSSRPPLTMPPALGGGPSPFDTMRSTYSAPPLEQPESQLTTAFPQSSSQGTLGLSRPIEAPTPAVPEQPTSKDRVIAAQMKLLQQNDPTLNRWLAMDMQRRQHEDTLSKQQEFQDKELRVKMAETQQARLENLEYKREALTQQAQHYKMQSENQALAEKDRHEYRRMHEETLKAGQVLHGQIAKMHDETSRANAQLASDTKKDVAAMISGNKPLTEAQANANIYASRLEKAHAIMTELDKPNGTPLEERISIPGLAMKHGAENTPLVGGALGAIGNTVLSPNQQRIDQAQRDFVNAVLRKESGAAIAQSEFLSAQKQYFPQPGDSKEVIAQKRKNRQTEIEGMRAAAGPAQNKPSGWTITVIP